MLIYYFLIFVPILPAFAGDYGEDDTFTIKMRLINQVQHNGGVTFSAQFTSIVKEHHPHWNGNWKSLSVYPTLTPESVPCELNEWETHSFKISNNYWYYPQVLDDDIEDIRFYVKFSAETSRFADVVADDGILIRNVRLWFAKTGKSRKDTPNYRDEKTYTVDDDFLLTPDPYEVKFGETPEPYATGNYWSSENEEGYKLLYAHVLIDESGYPINLFRQKDGSAAPYTDYAGLVHTVNRNNLMRTYQASMIKLRGSIIDKQDMINFRTVLEDYDSRYYLPISMRWNVKRCTFDGGWLHFWPSTLQGDFNADFGEDFFID